MLARVAESLYWIGRNVERSEHCSRYLKVEYFSTLDHPMSQNRDFSLRSILFMSGSSFSMDTMLTENDVWEKVIFDPLNPNSIYSIVRNARENARSIRNSISSELWEAINRWFIFYKRYNPAQFDSSDLFAFTEENNSKIALIKSTLNNTFLHNDKWHFTCAGIYIERVIQVLRILRSKISDSTILSDNGVNRALKSYQWTILLKSLEAFDIHKANSKGLIRRDSIHELILSNPHFPRSVQYSINKLLEHLRAISVKPIQFDETLAEFISGISELSTFDDYDSESQVISLIDTLSEAILNFHIEIQSLYFE